MNANGKIRIRTRILTVFTILLLLSFSLIWVIFNIAASWYIESNAVSQLEAARIMLLGMELDMERRQNEADAEQSEGPEIGGQRNVFRIQSNMFLVDEAGNALGGPLSEEHALIMQTLRGAGVRLDQLQNRSVRTVNSVYYISAHYMPAPTAAWTDEPETEPTSEQTGSEQTTPVSADKNAYWIIYADVSGLTYFANSINLFLIMLVCMMFAVTVVANFFLSNSITQPIKALSGLALRIGQGDFTPLDFKFTDIEFENLNVALNKTARQLDVYDHDQKTFFQNVSHELRTPLMSIKCYAEGISVGLMEPKKASETILQETDRMTEMVKDLLYISKLDNITSSFVTANADLLEIIRDCAERQSAIADTRGLRFVFDFEESALPCACVAELISRAVDNLISNAIRYALAQVTLSCKKEAGQVRIRVSDDGPGIDAESLPHIFERFYKGKGGEHGIGLSMAKSIAEQHNGTLSAENADAGGAVFTLTLPAS